MIFARVSAFAATVANNHRLLKQVQKGPGFIHARLAIILIKLIDKKNYNLNILKGKGVHEGIK